MDYDFIKELENYGIDIDIPYEKNPTDLIIKIINQSDTRLYYAIPLIIKNNMNTIKWNFISQRLTKKQFEIFDRIHKISLDILQKRKSEDPWFNEFFEHYKELKDNIKYKKEIKENSIKAEIKLNYDLSKIFSPKQIDIIKKRANNKKLNKTELEYYSRTIKHKINSILNNDLIDICKRAF